MPGLSFQCNRAAIMPRSAGWSPAEHPVSQTPHMRGAEPSRTLIVCGAGYVSGKEIMALELGRGLAKSRPVSFIRSYWSNGDFADRLRSAGLGSHILPIGFISATITRECLRMTLEQVSRWPGLLWHYARLLRRLQPAHVVHTNWHHMLLLLPLLRSERDIYWLHEFVPDRPQYRRLFRQFECRIACFVCVSHAVARSLRQLGISESKIKVIHNGIANPAGSVSLLALESSSPFRIGIVGQVGAWKGHGDLLEAFATVCKRHPHTELIIFGTGNAGYIRDTAEKAERLGVAARVRWEGFVSDRARIYGNLDVCVVATRSEEPFGLTAVEAGFFGLPVIATKRGGLPEIVEDAQNGLLVEAERPAELADAICRLIENPVLLTSIRQKASERAARFGDERFLRDFCNLLDAK